MSKEFNPKKTIDSIVVKIRKGELADKLKDLSDEDLFDIILESYEAGTNDTLNALSPLSQETGPAQKANISFEDRIEALEAAARAGQPSANE